jgi:hypothetical protein
MLQMPDHGMERAVRVIRRALTGHPVAALVHEPIGQCVGKPRFAHACFARDDDGPPLAIASPLPEVGKKRRLFAAAYESPATPGARGGEARFSGSLAQHAPYRDGGGEAFERSLAEALIFEAVAEQPMRARSDENRFGLGHRLQASGEIRRLAGDGTLSGRTHTEQVADNDDARGDADAYLQSASIRAFELSYFIDDGQRRADGMLRRIFVGPWIAEVGEHTVAHELRDETVEPDVRARVFGIERIRKLGRAHQIAEHDRDLSPLGLTGVGVHLVACSAGARGG